MKTLSPILVIAGMCAAYAPMAMAQSADVDAVATISEQLSVLNIEGGQNLSFGTVYKPNGAVPGGTCRYNMPVVANFSGHVMVFDLLADGSNDEADQSGCDQDGQTSYAEFTIGCTPGETVSYGFNYSSALTGIRLEPAALVPMRHSDPNGEDGNSEQINSANGHDHTCYDGGLVVLRLGGALFVDEDADVATDATVGTVSVDVAYN